MGIFDALTTAVGGLQAESFALQNISGNISNASTTGYKGIDTSFEDLIPDSTTPSRQVAGGVTAFAQATITTQGTVSASTVATNMAINGDGFFSVQKATGTVDNVPVFSGVTDYTRRGDFQVNANGNLVNGAGYYLMGVTVDPKTGNPLGNVPTVLQFQNNFVPAQATSTIQYAANLPAVPVTTASTTATAGSLVAAGGLDPADFSQNPLVQGTPAVAFGDATTTGATALNRAGTPGPISAATALSSQRIAAAGTAENSQLTTPTPITGATHLAGLSNTDSLTSSFGATDTITVNGKTITFSTSAATSTSASGGVINLNTGTVQDVLTAIDEISGTSSVSPSTISGGKVQLHDDAGDLTIVSSNVRPRLAALGFASGTVTAVNNSLTSNYTAGDTFTVDGQVFQFYNSSTTPPTAAGGTSGCHCLHRSGDCDGRHPHGRDRRDHRRSAHHQRHYRRDHPALGRRAESFGLQQQWRGVRRARLPDHHDRGAHRRRHRRHRLCGRQRPHGL